MGTLPNINYYKTIQDIRPLSEFWVEEIKTETPNGILIGYEGKAKISGLNTPYNEAFSPMDKICSTIRKRYQEKTGVGVTGLFKFEQGVIYGTFYPNYATCDDNKKAIDKVNTIFMATFINEFGILMTTAIDSWIMDPDNGYSTYCQYVADCADQGIIPEYDCCNKMFNRYLMAAGLKTKKDEERKKRFKKALKKGN